MSRHSNIAAWLLLLATAASTAAAAADAEMGAKIAARWCAECHLVSQSQRFSKVDVPSFAAIGRDPAFDAKRLSAFLMTPHSKMPDMSLTRAEVEDLVAHIRAQSRP